MEMNFTSDASEQLVQHPHSLYHWHHLTTAGIQEGNHLAMHHGITGSLIFGLDHPVTKDLIIQALSKFSEAEGWRSLILKTIVSLGKPLIPALIEAGFISDVHDQSAGILLTVPMSVQTLLRSGTIGEVTAILCSYSESLPGLGADSTVIAHITSIITHNPHFRNGASHSVPIHIHSDLSDISRRHGFEPKCKVYAEESNIDSLSLFNHHLKPFLKSFGDPNDQVDWLVKRIGLLDLNKINSYLGAHLIAACAICIRFEEPEKRINTLHLACDHNISLYSSSALVTRFFLRAAPPSLAAELLGELCSEHQTYKSYLNNIHMSESIADALSSIENSFYFDSFIKKSGLTPDCDYTKILPSFANISIKNLNDSRTTFIRSHRFAVAMFGQARHSAFRVVSDNLKLCMSLKNTRLKTCSFSTWNQTAAARYPKNIVELACLFKNPESSNLVRKALTEESVDRVYALMASHHKISQTNQNIHEALSVLCGDLTGFKINALEENDAEANFNAIYNVSNSSVISDIQKKVLMNQYKMWCTINAAIQSYLQDDCEQPLILHRCDVSLSRILEFIDDSNIFERQNIAVIADTDLEAFVVPPIGGMGDRFWIMTREAARIIHQFISSLDILPLINLYCPTDAPFNINLQTRTMLLEHHRYCDLIALMFAPSFYALPVGRAPIEADGLFGIDATELHQILRSNGCCD